MYTVQSTRVCVCLCVYMCVCICVCACVGVCMCVCVCRIVYTHKVLSGCHIKFAHWFAVHVTNLTSNDAK